jgi:hypothetical protein
MSRRMASESHAGHMREMRNVYRILVGELYGKRLFPRPMHRWVDTVEMYLKQKGWMDVCWIFLP